MNIRLIEELKRDAADSSTPTPDPRLQAARETALAALDALGMPEPLSSVDYRSAGNTLVIGTARDALPWADRLAAALPVTVLLLEEEGGEPAAAPLRVYPVLPAQAIVLSGWLGAFQATWQARGHAPQQGRFDLVLDLGATPRISSHQRPNGYQSPGVDESARTAAADALLGLVGDFEKPKYFAYKERLCAHGRNKQVGCTACIEICSAGAIEPAGDLVKVNPYLCAGCGACTTVCPSGALSYAFPTASHTGSHIKTMLRSWFDNAPTNDGPVLLLHAGPGSLLLDEFAAQGGVLPQGVLPLSLQHAASTGIDVWLAAIAWGAGGIAVLMTDQDAPQYLTAIDAQMTVAQAILSGLGYEGTHLRLLRADSGAGLATALRELLPQGAAPLERAGFNVALDKRNTLDYALEHLVRHAPPVETGLPEAIALPAASPFGALAIDKAACSLCMACVGACPSAALQDGQNAPALRFIEKNCVQCGLCATTCPEDAIQLVPRLLLSEARKQPVVLNETQPFHCIRCNKAFGTLKMVESMLGRMAAHPAFAGHLDRLRMCGDCRVIDMMTPADEVKSGESTELRRRR